MNPSPAIAGAFLGVLYRYTMSDKTYASFNTISITGRVSHVEMKTGKWGDFLSVTMLTELADDGRTIAVQFTNKNGLMTMFKNGNLKSGRLMTVTGHLEAFAETYVNAKGEVEMLTRPRLTLSAGAQVLAGGLGPAAKKDRVIVQNTIVKGAPPVDVAPVVNDQPVPSEVAAGDIY